MTDSRPSPRPHRRPHADHRPDGRARLLTVAGLSLGTALLLSGCTDDRPDPEPTAESLAEALASGDFSELSAAEGNLDPLTAGVSTLHEPFDGAAPEVSVTEVEVEEADEDSTQPTTATVSLHHSWPLDEVGVEDESWEYDTSAELRYAEDDETWQVVPDTEAILPEFTGEQAPTISPVAPQRGSILGPDGRALVSERTVYSIGIDKTRLLGDLQAADESVQGDGDGRATEQQQREAATQLAELVGIDASTFADQVVGHGEDAFVEAIVHRADSDEVTAAEVEEIPGAVAREQSMSLPVDEDLAPALIGTVGAATEEDLAEDPNLREGDQIGRSGVQAAQQEVLAGTEGTRISLDGETLFESEPTDGQDVQISLDPQIQRLAQQVVADVGQEASIVAVRPSDGGLVAAAGQGYVGSGLQHLYAPGSTFKVVTALTMLRDGLDPDSTVQCPAAAVVHGQQFNNVPGYPATAVGSIPFHSAVANSCNTTFAKNAEDVDAAQLSQAAADLGLAENEEFGLPVQMGSVPDDSEANLLAADMLGQGVVQASPLGMATVMASVAAGQTVQPHLVVPEDSENDDENGDENDDEDGGGLTAEEAEALTELLEGTVDVGTLDGMDAIPGEHVYAKTGTAEVGAGDEMYAHTWVIAFQGDLAVAIFVEDGDFGSTTNGPILHDFLSGVHEIRQD